MQLQGPRDAKLPTQMLATFEAASSVKAGSPNGRVECRVEQTTSTIKCHLPAAVLDLRFSSEGFAPVYRTAVALRSGPRTLEPLALKPGASLSGWVAMAGGVAVPPGIDIAVAPRGVAEVLDERQQRVLRATTFTAKPRRDGFFQVTGLGAGEVLVTVRGPGFAASTAAALLVPGRESQLRDPLLLSPPQVASFAVSPPVTPDGKPWRLFLARTDRYRSHLNPVTDTAVPTDGWLEVRGLSEGLYIAKLLAPNGHGWLTRELRIGEEPMPVALEPKAVEVRGHLTLGGEDLAGTIWFGGQYGAEKVEVQAGESGEYRTVLPRSGSWAVEVRAEEPSVARIFPAIEVFAPTTKGYSTVDIDLPDTMLSGSVRMEDGESLAPGTIVRAWPVAGGLWQGMISLRLRDKQRFELRGLAEGTFHVNADNAEARSATQVITLADDDERHVELVLRRNRTIAGRVVGDGYPVPGAKVTLIPVQEWAFVPTDAYTNGGGQFSSVVPSATTVVIAWIAVPGRTLLARRLDVSGDGPLEIELPRDGGELTVRFQGHAPMDASDWTVLLFRESAYLDPGLLRHWARLHPREGEPVDGAQRTPALAPGNYQACRVPRAELVRWYAGYRDLSRCASGHLPVFGQLDLELPSAGS